MLVLQKAEFLALLVECKYIVLISDAFVFELESQRDLSPSYPVISGIYMWLPSFSALPTYAGPE